MDLSPGTVGHQGAKGMAFLGFFVLTGMAVWILIDVFSGIFNWGLPGMVQWVEVLNVICVALPLPYVTLRRKHISMTLIQNRLSPSQQRVVDLVIFFVMFLFFAVVAWQVSLEAIYSCRNMESSNVGITVYWFPGKAALAFSLIVVSLVLLGQLINGIRTRRSL